MLVIAHSSRASFAPWTVVCAVLTHLVIYVISWQVCRSHSRRYCSLLYCLGDSDRQLSPWKPAFASSGNESTTGNVLRVQKQSDRESYLVWLNFGSILRLSRLILHSQHGCSHTIHAGICCAFGCGFSWLHLKVAAFLEWEVPCQLSRCRTINAQAFAKPGKGAKMVSAWISMLSQTLLGDSMHACSSIHGSSTQQYRCRQPLRVALSDC